jgi:hypothetical protein
MSRPLPTSFAEMAALCPNNLSLLSQNVPGFVLDSSFAAAIAASFETEDKERRERTAATDALASLLSSFGLSCVDESASPRDGNCLGSAVRWLLCKAQRAADCPADNGAFRRAIGDELCGPRRLQWQQFDSQNLSGVQYDAMVKDWVATGNWKHSMLPTALAAVPDAFSVVLVVLRNCRLQPIVTFSPSASGVRSVLLLGHEVSSKSHFRPVVQTERSLALSFDICNRILTGIQLVPPSSVSS